MSDYGISSLQCESMTLSGMRCVRDGKAHCIVDGRSMRLCSVHMPTVASSNDVTIVKRCGGVQPALRMAMIRAAHFRLKLRLKEESK